MEPKYSDADFNSLSSNSINRLSVMPRYWLKLVFHLIDCGLCWLAINTFHVRVLGVVT